MIRAVIFDLDGVLVQTEEHHFRSWRELADEERIPFDRETFDARMRGLERSDALAVLLERSTRDYSQSEREELAEAKNRRFLEAIAADPPRPVAGALDLLEALRRRGIKRAVGSSSRNARLILERTGLVPWIEVLVDAGVARGKPQPDIFLACAEQLGIPAARCAVVEDSRDGAEAGRRAGMRVVAIGPAERFIAVNHRVETLGELCVDDLLGLQDGLPLPER